jgi:hypothetical protein
MSIAVRSSPRQQTQKKLAAAVMNVCKEIKGVCVFCFHWPPVCVEIVTHDDTQHPPLYDCLYIRFYLGEASKEGREEKEAMTNAKEKKKEKTLEWIPC